MMNLCLSSLFLGFAALLQCQAQSYSDKQQKVLAWPNDSNQKVLLVDNVFGSIVVKAVQTDKVKLHYERTVEAKNDDYLTKGKAEIQVRNLSKGDTLVVYTETPNSYYHPEKGRMWANVVRKHEYDYQVDFSITVPNDCNLILKTINDGDISLEGSKAERLELSNVNGGISVKETSASVYISTVNGDISASFTSLPEQPNTISTINGDINLYLPKSLSAEMSFQSMNGDFYTDFDIDAQYAKTETSTGNGDKPTFKIKSKPVFSIGGGKVPYHFETLNGDVIIKQL